MKKSLLNKLLIASAAVCFFCCFSVLFACGEFKNYNIVGNKDSESYDVISDGGSEDDEEVSDGDSEFEDVNPHTHSFGEWELITSPTCTDTGKEERSCACGETQYKILDPTGHNFTDWVVTKEATCYEAGSESLKCSRCGAYSQTRELEMLEHTAGVWVTVSNPTCVTDGEKIRKCTVCLEEIETQITPAFGHRYGEWIQIKTPTCTSYGTQKRVCEYDGRHEETKEIAPLEHSCKWVFDSECHYEICEACGYKSESSPHEFEGGVCVCGFVCENDECETELIFEINEDGYYTVTGTVAQNLSEIEIPSEYKGIKVTAIAPKAFSGCLSLQTVYLSDTVESIGEGAFSYCINLSKIVLSGNLTVIGEEAFFCCVQLQKLIIPKTLNTIGRCAFYGCSFTFIKFLNKEGWYIFQDGTVKGSIPADNLSDPFDTVYYLSAYYNFTLKKI